MFRVSILKYEKGYKRFRVQATPKGEDKRIDKECDSEWECHELVQKWEREKPNPYKDSEWRETRTSLTPEQLNDTKIAVSMLPEGTTLCELVNANKRVLEDKREGVPEA